MSTVSSKVRLRARRKTRIRDKVKGTTERPRLSIFRSPKHLYAQVIDDTTGKTLASVHSYDADKRCGVDASAELGKQLAVKCKAASVSKVVFDKNGYAYHGRLKAFADGARSGGLDF